MKVLIDLTDTTGFAPDLGYRVRFEPKRIIGSATVPGRVITPAPVDVELVAGKGETTLEPGPHFCMIRAGNYRDSNPIAFTVPDGTAEMTLRELLEGQFQYDPEVLQEAQQYMVNAREWAKRAEQYKDEVFGFYTDANSIKNHRTAAETAQQKAEAAQRTAEEAAEEGEGHERAALAARQQAGTYRDEANNSKTAAGESAAAALASQNAAAESADTSDRNQKAAKTYQETAWTQRTLAAEAKNAALEAQKGAEAARDASGGHATDANNAADRAANAITQATTQIMSDTTALKDQARASAAEAQGSASSAKASEDAAAKSAASAAESVLGQVPGATTEVRGVVKLAGDLSGTADKPTVPALSLTAPGASLSMMPMAVGWSYAESAPAKTDTGWEFDGTWLKSPDGVNALNVLADWCGETKVEVRGRRRSDGTSVTISSIPAGQAEVHRHVSLTVDMTVYDGIGIAGTWIAGDLEAGCHATLTATPLGKATVEVADVEGLTGELGKKVEKSGIANRVYGTGANGEEISYPLRGSSSPDANSIPLRITGGAIRTGEPTAGDHATTRDYVDAKASATSITVSVLGEDRDGEPFTQDVPLQEFSKGILDRTTDTDSRVDKIEASMPKFELRTTVPSEFEENVVYLIGSF